MFGELYQREYENQGYVPPDDKLEEVLNTLTPREKFVLGHRFADKQMTLEEVGKICPRRNATKDGREIGVHKERARQIEAKALRKLRHPSRSRILWPDYRGRIR